MGHVSSLKLILFCTLIRVGVSLTNGDKDVTNPRKDSKSNLDDKSFLRQFGDEPNISVDEEVLSFLPVSEVEKDDTIDDHDSLEETSELKKNIERSSKEPNHLSDDVRDSPQPNDVRDSPQPDDYYDKDILIDKDDYDLSADHDVNVESPTNILLADNKEDQSLEEEDTDVELPDVPEDDNDDVDDLQDGYEVPEKCVYENRTQQVLTCTVEPVEVCTSRQEEKCKEKCDAIEVPSKTVCSPVEEEVCEDLPKENCKVVDETITNQVTVQVCDYVVRPLCVNEPVENCNPIEEEICTETLCTNVTVPHVTHTVEEHCEPVVRQECSDVWEKKCKEVPQKQCKEVWTNEMVWASADKCSGSSDWHASKSVWKRSLRKRSLGLKAQLLLRKLAFKKQKILSKLAFKKQKLLHKLFKRDVGFNQGYGQRFGIGHGLGNQFGHGSLGSQFGLGSLGGHLGHGSGSLRQQYGNGRIFKRSLEKFFRKKALFKRGFKPISTTHASKCWPEMQWKTVPKWKTVCHEIWVDNCEDVWVPKCHEVVEKRCQKIPVKTTRQKVELKCREFVRPVCDLSTNPACDQSVPEGEIKKNCSKVFKDVCQTTLVEKCQDNTEKVCRDVVKDVQTVVSRPQCETVTIQNCRKVDREVCTQVPQRPSQIEINACISLCLDMATPECHRSPVKTCKTEDQIVQVCQNSR